MRIIGGRLKGIRLQPPPDLPVRPTTDLAKEALFNILQHRISWPETSTLDLFSGTGNITFELASRGVIQVTAVDRSPKCCWYIKKEAEKLKLPQVEVVKQDVLTFIMRCKQQFDFIFADPPYDLPQLAQLPSLIAAHHLLTPEGLFVLEHPSTKQLNQQPGFIEQRKYGYSSFSFFSW